MNSKHAWSGGGVAGGYVTAIRNTPLLVLILFAYLRPAAARHAPRQDRVLHRHAVDLCRRLPHRSVPRRACWRCRGGLREAGLAIGLTEWQTKAWIIIPVMLRNVLPALGNNFISLFKDTSLAAAIAVPELTFYARQDQREQLPRGRDLAGRQPDVCRRLLPDRRCGCACFERRLAIPR